MAKNMAKICATKLKRTFRGRRKHLIFGIDWEGGWLIYMYVICIYIAIYIHRENINSLPFSILKNDPKCTEWSLVLRTQYRNILLV
jgi:hypothetical protein